jgi:glycosyltransferase involved in cell wall biosynthesis
MPARRLLFYSAWPLGYHNPEAERKALAFARAGYDTVYVAGVGTRNPRLRTAGKAVGRLRLAATAGRGPGAGDDGAGAARGVRTGSALVLPPRQAGLVRRLNRRLVRRSLAGHVAEGGVAWIRWPTPELVDVLPALRPGAIVYECVDGYHDSPGMTGRWLARHEDAERALVAIADAIVVPGAHLAARFEGRGTPVHVVSHGVDLDLFPFVPPRVRTGPEAVIGFVGTLDYKLDLGFLRAAARSRPHWRIRLIGPVQEGFDPQDLADLPNLTVEPPIPYAAVGPAIAGFDASMMPYYDAPMYRASAPLKNLEIMAVGRPAVGRPTVALEPYRDLVGLAETPEAFVAELDRALAEDSLERALERRAVAERHGWDGKLTALVDLLADLGAGPRRDDAPLPAPPAR